MLYPLDDTIAAKATADGGGARGIVRISGPHVVSCLQSVFRADPARSWRGVRQPTVFPGEFSLQRGRIWVPGHLYFWPHERSYTRQRCAELHSLGSPPLLELLLQEVCRHGARLAQPGEFTLRAFLAGRIDLPQAEAVLGVIDAQTSGQLDSALSQLAGGLSSELDLLRDDLLNLTADIEAGLDFVEEDISFVTAEQQVTRLESAARRVHQLVEKMQARGLQDTEPRVVLVGRPNTGKSSLLNALADDSAAIVTSEAGTTRDYLLRPVDLDGVRCVLVDTAGIEAADAHAAPRRSAQVMMQRERDRADLELFCLDASHPLHAHDAFELLRERSSRLLVLTKGDLTPRFKLPGALLTSCRTGQGLAELRSAIRARLAETVASRGDVVTVTAIRCRENLRQIAACLGRARALVIQSAGEELVAAETRLALDHLGQIVGTVYTEDVLERIFGRFCIGK